MYLTRLFEGFKTWDRRSKQRSGKLLSGRDFRAFELELALGLRLIKTAALAHRACRVDLSEWLLREAQKEFVHVSEGLEAMAPADRLRFADTAEEVRDRIEEFKRLMQWKRNTHGRAKRAGSTGE